MTAAALAAPVRRRSLHPGVGGGVAILVQEPGERVEVDRFVEHRHVLADADYLIVRRPS